MFNLRDKRQSSKVGLDILGIGSVRIFWISDSLGRGLEDPFTTCLFLVRFGSDSFGFGSAWIVKLGTGKYPEKIWFSFGSGWVQIVRI